MKVLLLSFQNAQKDVNGVACHIRDLHKVLNEVNIETDILSPYSEYSGLYDYAVSKLIKLFRRFYQLLRIEIIFYLMILLTELQLKNRLKSKASKYTIINAQDIISLVAATNLKIKIPIVFTCHFLTEPWKEFSNAGYFKENSFFFQMLINKSRKALLHPKIKFISVSNRNRDLLFQFMPEIKAENVKVAYLGLDVRYDLKKVEMNLPDLDYILNVGKIDRIKNQRLFIGLAEVLKKNNKKILIILVGPSDLEEKEYINKTIKEKNLENYFLFTNALNRDSVYYLMQNSLLYIHTAQMESFGMAIVEAIGSGATVLVRENDAIDEILQGNREGVFGRDFTELEFYTFVNAFLESKEKRENLKKMQEKIFKSKYTIEKMRDSFLKYYKEFEVAENG